MKFGNSIHKYISRRHNLLCASLAFATVLGVPAGTASAQDTSDEIEKLNQKVELLNAKTSLANARLDYANVIFEQLPSFSGETTTDDNTGKFEATILSADAIDHSLDAESAISD